MSSEPTKKSQNIYIAIHHTYDTLSVAHTRASSPEEAIDNLDLGPWTYPEDWIDWAEPNKRSEPSRQEAIKEVLRTYRNDPAHILIEITPQGVVSRLGLDTK